MGKSSTMNDASTFNVPDNLKRLSPHGMKVLKFDKRDIRLSCILGLLILCRLCLNSSGVMINEKLHTKWMLPCDRMWRYLVIRDRQLKWLRLAAFCLKLRFHSKTVYFQFALRFVLELIWHVFQSIALLLTIVCGYIDTDTCFVLTESPPTIMATWINVTPRLIINIFCGQYFKYIMLLKCPVLWLWFLLL
jgi:hypothetical protein